jgi:hypothetical protein
MIPVTKINISTVGTDGIITITSGKTRTYGYARAFMHSRLKFVNIVSPEKTTNLIKNLLWTLTTIKNHPLKM